MSAISHKVNTRNDLVNDYLGGHVNPEPSQVHAEGVTSQTLKPYLNPASIWNRAHHYWISY